uniref:helix-turn-helix domain-containing protein n=1 Tax=Mesorhizobium sp. L-8-3 TaxID=2744522 RepID=UPI001927851A|nr:AraC family transcriptional regulator [Mesorhizobium sp. L-8-3]
MAGTRAGADPRRVPSAPHAGEPGARSRCPPRTPCPRVRRRFGCTIGHYVRQRRVEFGCHRLAASLDPLSEIALDAGFADQSHFTNTFRRLVGMSPGVFRSRFFEPPRWPRM